MKKGNVFIIIGLLLIAAALLLTGYNVWDSHRAGQVTYEALEQLTPLINDDPVPVEGRIAVESSAPVTSLIDEIEYPDYILNPEMEMPTADIDGNDYIGILSIPVMELELPILSDWDYSKLKISPCRYTGSAYLDNMVICAHNYDIHFGYLKYLSYGDTITFTDVDGNVFKYKVIEVLTLQPTAIEEMITGDWDLTLFTCTIGGATRVTVRCEKVEA